MRCCSPRAFTICAVTVSTFLATRVSYDSSRESSAARVSTLLGVADGGSGHTASDNSPEVGASAANASQASARPNRSSSSASVNCATSRPRRACTRLLHQRTRANSRRISLRLWRSCATTASGVANNHLRAGLVEHNAPTQALSADAGRPLSGHLGYVDGFPHPADCCDNRHGGAAGGADPPRTGH